MNSWIPQAAKWRLIDRLDYWITPPLVERLLVKRMGQITTLAMSNVDTLYVDISVIHKDDAGTGIQRVVRSILNHLPEACLPTVRIVPVVVRKRREGYVTLEGEPVTGKAGAVFFGLDFATDSVFRHRRALAEFKRLGGRVWIIVHDTLPIRHPEWFTHASCVKYRRWMRVCAALADGFLCVSSSVADELRDLLSNRYGRADLPLIETIALGSDITPADWELSDHALLEANGPALPVLEQAVLMVGTFEPRKGHKILLDAFDLLWQDGQPIPLILVGRPGWGTQSLQERVRMHPENGRLLFWLESVDDFGLHASYLRCRMTIVPSLGEGYGLPLDEALAMGSPVLARDMPVFHRHERASLRYFPADADAGTMARSISSFYAVAERTGSHARLPTWFETARQALVQIGCAV